MRAALAAAFCASAALGFTSTPRSRAAPPRRAARTAPRMVLGEALLAGALLNSPIDASRLDAPSPSALPTLTTAGTRTVTKEGLYGEYTVVIEDTPDGLDDARSTFKSRAATKKGKNKYLGIFVVLLFGSFVIPMAQYFWYVRDTPESLFSDNEPPPPPPAKKNFWER